MCEVHISIFRSYYCNPNNSISTLLKLSIGRYTEVFFQDACLSVGLRCAHILSVRNNNNSPFRNKDVQKSALVILIYSQYNILYTDTVHSSHGVNNNISKRVSSSAHSCWQRRFPMLAMCVVRQTGQA